MTVGIFIKFNIVHYYMFSRVNVFILYLYDSIYAIKNQTKNKKRLLSPLQPYFVRSLGNDFYSVFIYNNFCKEE